MAKHAKIIESDRYIDILKFRGKIFEHAILPNDYYSLKGSSNTLRNQVKREFPETDEDILLRIDDLVIVNTEKIMDIIKTLNTYEEKEG